MLLQSTAAWNTTSSNFHGAQIHGRNTAFTSVAVRKLWWRWLYPSFPWTGARAFGLARHLSAFHDEEKSVGTTTICTTFITSLPGSEIPFHTVAMRIWIAFLSGFIISLFGKAFGKDKRKRICLGGGRVAHFHYTPDFIRLYLSYALSIWAFNICHHGDGVLGFLVVDERFFMGYDV
jgi:hypothetical protein